MPRPRSRSPPVAQAPSSVSGIEDKVPRYIASPASDVACSLRNPYVYGFGAALSSVLSLSLLPTDTRIPWARPLLLHRQAPKRHEQAARLGAKMTDTAPGTGEDDKTLEQSQAQGSTAEAAVEISSPSAPRRSGHRKSTSTSSERAAKHTQTESEGEDEDGDSDEDDEEEEESSEEEDEDDEEPRLKYESLTKHLGPLYRNADATSSFLVGGDKMVWKPISATAGS